MNTLLVSSAFGIFWLVFLFALCFFGVHIARLARFGQAWRKQHATPPAKEESEKKTPPPEKEQGEREPIYYIVERKKRTKSSFGEPKQIRFK